MTKPTPSIGDARAIGERYNLRGVVILHHDGLHVGYASWGDTRSECTWMRRLGDLCFAALMQMWIER